MPLQHTFRRLHRQRPKPQTTNRPALSPTSKMEDIPHRLARIQRALHDGKAVVAQDVLHLQRTIGNQAVMRMFPTSTKVGGQATAFPDLCKTPSPFSPTPIPYPTIQSNSESSSKESQKEKVAKAESELNKFGISISDAPSKSALMQGEQDAQQIISKSGTVSLVASDEDTPAPTSRKFALGGQASTGHDTTPTTVDAQTFGLGMLHFVRFFRKLRQWGRIPKRSRTRYLYMLQLGLRSLGAASLNATSKFLDWVKKRGIR